MRLNELKLTQTEKTVLGDLVHALKSELGVKQVMLYGSAARGSLDIESDIDLLVVLPEVDWEIEKRVGGLAFDADPSGKLRRCCIIFAEMGSFCDR